MAGMVKLMSCTEAASQLGIPHRTLQYRASRGIIKAEKLGRDWFFKPGEVARHAKKGPFAGRPAGRRDSYKRKRRRKIEA